jgi:Tc5 transposase DNA-binding domain
MNNSTKNDRISAALEALDSQKSLNYTAAAREFGEHGTTLMRRYCGKSVSREESHSETRQRLNNIQEDELLRYIDTLTDRFVPPTTQIIKNLAEEILKGPVGKNWTTEFIKRHSARVSSVYLRSLDRARVSAESPATFEHFYQLVYIFSQFFELFS